MTGTDPSDQRLVRAKVSNAVAVKSPAGSTLCHAPTSSTKRAPWRPVDRRAGELLPGEVRGLVLRAARVHTAGADDGRRRSGPLSRRLTPPEFGSDSGDRQP
jgi:hypothetical protein